MINPNLPIKGGIGINQGNQNTNPIQPQLTAPTSQGEKLDPSVVALTKSIGKQESGGNYKARGKDGEIGAYQFTKGFIQDNAPKYLGTDYNPDDLTPDQQDKLAYSTIKDWGTSGKPGYQHMGKLSPAQIASAWNAGDPTAYLDEDGNQGISNGGAKYNTSEYVSNIQKNFDEANRPQPEAGMSGFDKSVTLPVAGGLTVAGGAAAVASGGILPTLGGLAGRAWTAIKGAPKALIGGIVSDAVKEAIPETASVLPAGQESFASRLLGESMPKASEASNKLADTLLQVITGDKTGRVAMQDPMKRESVNIGAKYGLAPDTVNGTLDFSGAEEKRMQTLGKLSKGVQTVLEDESSPLQSVIERAKRDVKEHSPSNEWEEADRHIDNIAKTYRKNFAKDDGSISNARLEQMKQEMWHGQKFDVNETNAKRAAKKALGFSARATITDNTQHKEFYNTAMKEEQGLINFGKMVKKMNGKKAPETASMGKGLLKMGGEYVSTYIGARIGGPIGAVLGDIIGNRIRGKIDKKFGSNIFEAPQVQKAILEIEQENPEVYDRLVHELELEGITMKVAKNRENAKVLRLSAPSFVSLGPVQGKDESVVVGGKKAPVDFEQAKKRSLGKPEYGGLTGYLRQQQDLKKQIKPRV